MKLKIAENLKKYRLENNMTQEQLAEKLGVSFQAVSRWENRVTYPDIEMLPSLSELFGVSLEQLMGVTKEERAEASDAYYAQLNRITDHEERLKLLYEIHREYPHDDTILWNLCGETDDLEEKRNFTDELIRRAQDNENTQVYANRAIQWMINAEDEDKLQPFLRKHTAPMELCTEIRLEDRYQMRKEWDRYELTKQENLRKSLINAFGRMVRNYPPVTDVHNSLWASQTKLAIIDLLTGTAGTHPVSGDGVPDLWFEERFRAGIRLSCQLASAGEAEKALDALEDLTGLFVSFWSLPDDTKLTFRCPALDCIEGTLHTCMMKGPAAGPAYGTIRRNAVTLKLNTGKIHSMWCHTMVYPLIHTEGWEWFNPIRNEPRFLACAERMKQCVVEEAIGNP